jgi:tetratricopeptide (TPR) repeat protein
MDGLSDLATSADSFDEELAQGTDPRPSYLLLGNQWDEKYGETATPGELNEAIRLLYEANDAIVHDTLYKAKILNNLGLRLRTRYLETRNSSDLEESIHVIKSAVDISTSFHEVSGQMSEDHPDRALITSNLAISLESRYDESNVLPDIEKAIELMRTSLAITTSPLPRAQYLIHLGELLYKFSRSKKFLVELEEALRVTHTALTLIPDTPDQARPLSCLAKFTFYTHLRARTGTDLDEAIRLARLANQAASECDPERSRYMSQLGRYLSTRYSLTESEADLEGSIEYLNAAIDNTPEGHANMAPRRVELARQLSLKYLRSELMPDLDKATQVLWLAVKDAKADSQMSILRAIHSYALRKYGDTDTLDDLNELIRVMRVILDSSTQDDRDRTGWLGSLGLWLRARYGKTGEKSDLEEAINLTQEALDKTTEDEYNRKRFSTQLRALHSDLSLGVGLTSELQEKAIQITRAAVTATREATTLKMEILSSFFSHINYFSTIMGMVNFTEQVVGATRAAFDIIPAYHPARLTVSRPLARSLMDYFEYTSDVDALNEAILVLNAAIHAAPDDYCDLEAMLSTLRQCLMDRYNETEEYTDDEDTINILKSTIHIDANNHETQSKALNFLSMCLARSYEVTPALSTLDEAITFSRKATELATGRRDRRKFSGRLGFLLGSRYERTHVADDLEEAIQLARTAADEASLYLHKAPYLKTLADLLSQRFKATDSIADILDAVQISREVVNNIGKIAHPAHHSSLCIHLRDLFHRTGIISHLEEAIRVQRIAVFTAQSDDPERWRYLYLLGYCLYLRYCEIETESDSEEAIQLLQEGADIAPEDSSYKARYLIIISMCLGARHERTGVRTDLDEAVCVARRALDAAPKGSPNRALVLRELSYRMNELHSLTGVIGEIETAIGHAAEAVDITLGGKDHGEALNCLGLHLAAKYKKTGATADIDEAIRVTRAAVDSALRLQDKPRYLKHVLLHLQDKYEKTRQMTHLNEAIQAAKEAVNITPKDHPEFAEVIGILGIVLEERYSRTRATPDLREAILCHRSALEQANAQVRTRIEAGIDALRCCALVLDWQEAYEVALIVANLVPTLSLRSLKNSEKQHVLSFAAGLGSDIAATALNAAKDPSVALDLLEHSRGLLATSLEEMRTDVLELREKHPDLAEEFIRLQGELNLQASRDEAPPSHSRPSTQLPLRLQTSQPYQTDKEFDQLLVNIRSQPDFATFLLPPSREEMMQAALHGGPIIVINVSKYRSDAVLVEQDTIRVIALPRLQNDDVRNKTLNGEIGAPHTLEWLWDVLAKPVLDALGYTSRPSGGWPRVWWIPIGPLSRFPLHAAGRHEQGRDEAVIDRVMSSYSSSIKALIRGRQGHLRSELTPSIPPRALLVAMPNTPGHAPLRFANAEVDVLRKICKAIPADFIDPGQLRDDIVAQLPGCSIFHFAGHGSTNSGDPSQSHLLTYDGKITVGALLEINLRKHSPFLAYLSACGTGRVRDDAFLDESIHLISAFQLAGFRHVIGTLWEVKDKLCTEMARLTYEGIQNGGMTDHSVCLGLHNAARELRNRWLMGEVEEGYREDQHVQEISNTNQIVVRSEAEVSVRQSVFSRDILPIEVEHPTWVPYVHFGV